LAGSNAEDVAKLSFAKRARRGFSIPSALADEVIEQRLFAGMHEAQGGFGGL
jgi:hypothetical protein